MDCRRNGASLVELLVVIGIMAMAIGLLLPAIQRVRDASQKTVSRNNLKQIGLAIQNYTDSNDGKVPAVVNNAMGESKSASLFAVLLPYIEQGSVYEAYLQSHVSRAIRAYISPADPTVNADMIMQSPSSYAANAQLFANQRKLVSIADGLSNTIAFAEHYSRCKDVRYDYVAGWVCMPPVHRATFAEGGPSVLYPAFGDVYPKTQNGITYPSIRGATFQVRPNPIKDCAAAIPQTPHFSGMLVAYVDGSVRTVNAAIQENVFWSLVTPDGGEIVDGY